jgi:hypothetical protein
MHRPLAAVLLVSVLTVLQATVAPASAQEAAFCPSGEQPIFRFGFAAIKAQVGDAMGDPTECEHSNPENGDTLQATTTGLSFYRKSTNTPTFTDGFRHWGLTSAGLAAWTGESIDPPGTAVAAPPSPSRAPAAPAPPAPAPAAERPRRIGDTTVLTAPDGLRLALTVNGTADNVQGRPTFMRPQGRWYAIDWTIKNEGTTDFHVNRLYFKIQTPDGFLIERAAYQAREPDLVTNSLGPGQMMRGWLTYDVPAGQSVKAAIFQAGASRQFVVADLP